MAYNNKLELLIDGLLSESGNNLSKKKIFGGVGYLINGNICFGIHGDHLVLRTSEFNANTKLVKKGYKPFDITGRPMRGWVMVTPRIYNDPGMLRSLLNEGLNYAKTLPAK